MKVKDASVFIDELKEDTVNPPKVVSCSMPWSKTINEFNFRPGEVTLYAGSNGGGKSLITGQIALGLIKQGEKVCIMSF
jgi:twinkle protein